MCIVCLENSQTDSAMVWHLDKRGVERYTNFYIERKNTNGRNWMAEDYTGCNSGIASSTMSCWYLYILRPMYKQIVWSWHCQQYITATYRGSNLNWWKHSFVIVYCECTRFLISDIKRKYKISLFARQRPSRRSIVSLDLVSCKRRKFEPQVTTFIIDYA